MLIAVLYSSILMAAEEIASPVATAQKIEIEKVIHDYLIANPEILVEVSQSLQQKQQQKIKQEAKAVIKMNTEQLFQNTPNFSGNPKANVTIVEFFDYQCGHCKTMSKVMDGLIAKHPSLRIIYKELPILGKDSEFASRAALAAGMQNKYSEMNRKLLAATKPYNEKIIMDIAKSLGLNIKKLKEDMTDKKVTETIDANRNLAEKLHLMGTPAFIIASTPEGQFKTGSEPSLIPGEANEELFNDLIKKASL